MRHSLLLVAAIAALTATVARGADGDLDTDWWTDGTTWFDEAAASSVGEVLVSPDGAYAVVIGTRSTNGYWSRYPSTGGILLCSVGPTPGFDAVRLNAAAFDPAGRLVVAGAFHHSSSGWQLAFLRYLFPSCALDEDFGSSGRTILPIPDDDSYGEEVHALAIEPGFGLIAAAGTVNEPQGTADSDVVVVMLNPAGDPLSGFSTDGWHRFDPLGVPAEDQAKSVAWAAGRLLVASSQDAILGSGYEWVVSAFEFDGDIDTSFGEGDGDARSFFPGSSQSASFDMAREPSSGALVLSGWLPELEGSGGLGVTRLHADGTLDTSFSGDGRYSIVPPATAPMTVPRAVAIDDLGRVIVGGSGAANGGNFWAGRLTPSGAPDPTFGGDGWAHVGFEIVVESADNFHDLAIAPGTLLLAGTTVGTSSSSIQALAALEFALLFADGFESGEMMRWSDDEP